MAFDVAKLRGDHVEGHSGRAHEFDADALRVLADLAGRLVGRGHGRRPQE
jgi:hypothetical protein